MENFRLVRESSTGCWTVEVMDTETGRWFWCGELCTSKRKARDLMDRLFRESL
jgi:hypothetical protein